MITKQMLTNEIRMSYLSSINDIKNKLKILKGKDGRDSLGLATKVLRRALGVKGRRDPTHSLQMYGESLHLTVYLYINSLKADDFCDFMMWMEDNVAECRYSSDWVNSSTASREFTFWLDKLNVTVICDLPTEGEQCSRIQTGFEMVEKAVYKLQCN